MGHLTNPEEAEKRRVAGNKGRTPANKKGKYWWSEYTDPFTKPVDKFLSGALGPAAKPVQGLLSLGTPAEAVNKALDKPTAGNIIEAAADVAATAAGGKAILGTGKAVNKTGPAVKATSPARKTVKATPPVRRENMGKYRVAKSIFDTGRKAFKNTPENIKDNIKAQRAAPSRKNPGKEKFTPSGAKPKPVTPKAAANPKAKPTPVTPKAAANPKAKPITDPTKQTNTNTGRAPYGGRGGATTPSPKTPKNPKNPKGIPMSTAQKVALTALGTGAAGAALSPTEPMTGHAEPVSGKKIPGTGGSSSKSSAQTPSANKTKASNSSSKSKADDGFKFYGDEGTGLGDFSRKYGMQYATQEQTDKDFDLSDGAKAGGRPGKGNLKTQGMNKTAKRKAGFSGKGSGAALRGF